MAKILIIDDDKMLCKTMFNLFEDLGHNIKYAFTLEDGENVAKSDRFDVIFLDVRLPDGSGIQRLPTIQASPSSPEVIILTAYADPDGAELALRNNAWDYIKKPASIDTILLALTRALQYREKKDTKIYSIALIREGIVGNSTSINTCLDAVARAAHSDSNILITGETGTGKELFSRAIHANSLRAKENFVAVDCGSLPKTLMESLLFGHRKGAFTSADKDREGLIKHADGGTLFLDEVSEIPLEMQKVFLRVIQERRFRPLSEKKEIHSDFRLISASNRNLDEMAKKGGFRKDLLFRLNSICIELPPLRERKEDIKDLVLQCTKILCESHEIGIKGFSPEFFEVLELYDWPGNVRELQGTVESAFALALHEPVLFPKHLPPNIRVKVARSFLERESQDCLIQEEGENLPQKLPGWKEYKKSHIAWGEKKYLEALYSRTGGNIKKAAQLSGLSQPRLYELLRKHKVSIRKDLFSSTCL